jgi:hypothetical protein
MRLNRPGKLMSLGVIGVIGLLALVACNSGISQEEAAAKDQQIAELQSQVNLLQGQVNEFQEDSKFWSQLTSLMQPVDMPSMTDHRAFMLPESGTVLALHFDSMDLEQAENLNWVALGVPGVFCKDDQDRVEEQFGPGFTHFHDMVNDLHGGAPGAEGVWFVHTAVREFQAPWGAVSQGIDHNFMPTPAPEC